MTKRAVLTRAYGVGAYAICDTGASKLRAVFADEDLPVLSLPPLLCAPAYVTSARSFAGAAHSQNSTDIRYAQGHVKQQGVAVSRTVAVYRRDTKELITTGESGANGFFRLEWKGYTGPVFVVVFDDTRDNADYNCKVFDLITS